MNPNKKYRRCKFCKTLGHYRSTCPIERNDPKLKFWISVIQYSRLEINCLLNMVSRWGRIEQLQTEVIKLYLTRCYGGKKIDYLHYRFLERLSNMLMNVKYLPFKAIEFSNWVPEYDQIMRLIQIFTTNKVLRSTSIEFTFNYRSFELEQNILNMLLTIKGYMFSIERKPYMHVRRYPITKIIINKISKL